MLLRRSQWVPSGPFRRLQIAFKPIHPGEGEGGEGTKQPLELRKPRQWARAGVGTRAGGKQFWSRCVLASLGSVNSASPVR